MSKSPPGPSEGPSEPRLVIRHRARVSCAQCVRRKIRCDRSEPCAACRNRGEAAACQYARETPPSSIARRSQSNSGPIHDETSPARVQVAKHRPDRSRAQENVSPVLRNRNNLDLLTEPAVWNLEDHLTGGSMTAKRNFTPRGYTKASSHPRDPVSNGVTALSPAASRILVPPLQAPHDVTLEYCLAQLYGYPFNLDLLVERYFTHASWHFLVLHRGAFLEEYAAFALMRAMGWQQRVDPLWISCLLMVVALATITYDEVDQSVFNHMSAEEVANLNSQLFRLATIALECGDWLGEARLRTLQALALIDSYLLWAPLPESTERLERYSVVAVRICWALGLLKIPDDPALLPELDQAASQLALPLRRELSLRLLYTTAALDMFNHRHRPALKASDIQSPLPGNYDDNDLNAYEANAKAPQVRLTDASFIIILYDISVVQKTYQDGVLDHPKPPLGLLKQTKDAIESLMNKYRLDDVMPDEPLQRSWSRQLAKLHLLTRCVRTFRTWISMDSDLPEATSARDYLLKAARALLGCACDLFASGAPLMRGVFHLMHIQASCLILIQSVWSKNELLSTADEALISASIRLYEAYGRSLHPAIRRSGNFAVATNQHLLRGLRDRHSFPGINETFVHALKTAIASVRQQTEPGPSIIQEVSLAANTAQDPFEPWTWLFESQQMADHTAGFNLS